MIDEIKRRELLDKLISLWNEVSSKERIDIKSKGYRKFAKLRSFYYRKYLSKAIPINDFDIWLAKVEQEKEIANPGKSNGGIEELSSLGDWPEPADRFEKPLDPWD
jgi:hypothetical protein